MQFIKILRKNGTVKKALANMLENGIAVINGVEFAPIDFSDIYVRLE